MTAQERRQYEMLLRVRGFGISHGHMLPASGAGPQALAAINAAIDELAATALKKRSAFISSRADAKAAARRALTRLLARVSGLARILRARGCDLPAFEVPRASKSDVTLLTAGRQFARDAALFEAEFTDHGMGPAVIAAATTKFEEASRKRGISRSEHVGARARMRDVLTTAMQDVRRLDLILAGDLASDAVVQTTWQQARRVHDPRRPRNVAAEGEPSMTLVVLPRPAAARLGAGTNAALSLTAGSSLLLQLLRASPHDAVAGALPAEAESIVRV
jgi:hypothetical protein